MSDPAATDFATAPHPGRTITACDGRPPCGVCEACRQAAPTPAPGSRAVVALLAWLDAYEDPDGWPHPSGVVLYYDHGERRTVDYPAHAAATVRGLVEEVGRLRAENERLRLPFPFEQRGYVLGAAVRYQIGRRTYGSGIVADAVVAAWPTLHAGDRAAILRDVREAFAREDVGDACDAAEWRRILALAGDHARAAGGDAGADHA